MRLGFTPIQIRKLGELSQDDIEKLIWLAYEGGVIVSVNKGAMIYSQLLELRFLKKKGQKVWANFAINGELPSPFLGHKKRKVTPTTAGKILMLFGCKFRGKFRMDVGASSGKEYKLASIIGKEFDIDEIGKMFDLYFSNATYLCNFTDFYLARNKLFRKINVWGQNDNSKTEENTSKNNGW